MLACQPNLKGAYFVFEYIRLFDQVSQLDAQFSQMLKQRYPEEQGPDSDVIQASITLSLDIAFTPEKFVSRITSATRVPNGYDAVLNGGPVLQLRRTEGNWVATFPPEVGGQFSTVHDMKIHISKTYGLS